MGIRVALHHKTVYRYDRPVQLAPHVVRLRPAPHARTPVDAYSLKIAPKRHFLNWQQDPFGNWQARLVFPEPTDELVVEVDLIADMTVVNPFDFFLEESAETYPFTYEASVAKELEPYRERMTPGPLLAAFVERVRGEFARSGRRVVDVLVDVNQAIQRSLRYDIRMEPGVFSPDETLERRHGSCRDFAWLQVQVLRHLGIAARFVSGYSIQLKADRKPLEGPAGVSEDATDLHAWAEAYLPGAGWVGLDATSGLFCGEGHIPLACTAEPRNAAPITGAFSWDKRHEGDQVDERFEFSMKVERIDDPARPSKPFTDADWDRILVLGDKVDEALTSGDVRLTMGGEPTFVSLDDPDGAEWNTAALGPEKARIADALARRLMKRFAPGGLLHHGQGKWYPGESLPRWAYNIYFRRDGEPVWNELPLIADGLGRERSDERTAARFLEGLASRLRVDAGHAEAGYEDTWYYLWRERRLPVNVDPFDSKLESEEERARLRRVFEQGLAKVVGYALPLRDEGEGTGVRWQSGPWFLRNERMYLLPGDSPMGYRLPLDSLPWASAGDALYHWERDPLAPRPPLPPRARTQGGPMMQAEARFGRDGEGGFRLGGAAGEGSSPPTASPPARGTSMAGLVRTAICVEPRGGTLHLFLPPVSTLEAYLDLVAHIEDTAAAIGTPVRIEGYHPPSDHRLGKFSVTPDPGVIEVNVLPVRSWRELVDQTTIVYDEARSVRLGTDKFLLDGRHTGTGGGNHIALGGPSPADSPFLRRPDLLRSLVGYWLNHPSLSYLFSGLFVGPTSQAPRIDEARHDALDELEIAYGQLPSRGGPPPPPWLVDRLFRHLLVDVTGNTHRTEICIDKLYNPEGATGRQGLVELRAFEMPPDARMSALQQLLVRSLVAWFWNEPYERRPVRWGTALHDRFALPHFVMEDFEDVLDELRHAGFPFERGWFDAQMEFRFPTYGRLVLRGAELELRAAVEPWHVLGEEPGAGGTVRYVDSSVERLQVLARGLTEGRHVVACNGRRVPLHPTGTNGEEVAGVRFRAWQPPSALHPTIGVHSPLVFDVIDTWAGRSLGGCTYHVAHPGGRAFERAPANGLEAESRRVSRFQRFGHSPGPVTPPPEERSRKFPYTLDLRRPSRAG